MLKFTFGLILLAFSTIVGGFRYLENRTLITNQERQYEQAVRDKQEAGRMAKKIEAIKELTLRRGEDQRLNLERTIGLPPNIEFRFTSEADPNSPENQYFYRHNFEITGMTDFYTGLRLLNRLENMTGFVVYSACFACLSPPMGTEGAENERMFQIKGLVYVYNPETLDAQ
jgi:hypothetical protein